MSLKSTISFSFANKLYKYFNHVNTLIAEKVLYALSRDLWVHKYLGQKDFIGKPLLCRWFLLHFISLTIFYV